MFKIIFLFPLLLISVSCVTHRPDTVAPKFDTITTLSWVDSKTLPAKINVSGEWESTSHFMAGGWGRASLVQTNSRVTGTLGLYTVEGRTSGKQCFIVISSSGRLHFTAILEMTPKGGLSGLAVTKTIADTPEARVAERHPIHLVRRK